MEGVAWIILLLLIVVLILIIENNSKLTKRLTSLEKELRSISQRLGGVHLPEAEKKPISKEQQPARESVSGQPIPQPEKKEKPPVMPPAPEEVVLRIDMQPPVEDKKTVPEIKPRAAFNLERIVGENWLNKVGILLFVFGMGFLIKYAIDNDYIGEAGRIAIGAVTGLIIITIAHRIRTKYRAFSSVLIGGGLAILYFSFSFAYQEYQLIGQTAAFAVLVGITTGAVALSLIYNRVELAVFAIIGGFSAPLLVSGEENNPVMLFTYIAILDLGMLFLAYFKKWNIVNLIAFGATYITIFAWMYDSYDETKHPGSMGIFSSLFYMVFLLQNLLNNLKNRTAFTAFDFMMLLSNSFIYYAIGLYLTHGNLQHLQGPFTALLAVVNLALFGIVFRQSETDKNLKYLFLGLGIGFFSLIGPIWLKGNHISLFWWVEMSVLVLLFLRSKIVTLGYFVLLVLLAAFVSILPDWSGFFDHTLTINQIRASHLVALLSIAVGHTLVARFTGPEKIAFLKTSDLRTVLSLLGVTILYMALFCEIWNPLVVAKTAEKELTVIMESYTVVYSFFALLGLYLRPMKRIAGFIGTVALFSVLLFTIHTNTAFGEYLSAHLFYNTTSTTAARWYYFAGVAFSVGALILMQIRLQQTRELPLWTKKTHLWVAALLSVVILSIASDHVALIRYLRPPSGSGDEYEVMSQWLATKQGILRVNRRFVYPVLWSAISFSLAIIGFRKRARSIRIVGLSLFFITLLKLFLSDVWSMTQLARIIAFITLGVLLLVVSFLYQKLKTILFENEPENGVKENAG